jgi:hypothetical protein
VIEKEASWYVALALNLVSRAKVDHFEEPEAMIQEAVARQSSSHIIMRRELTDRHITVVRTIWKSPEVLSRSSSKSELAKSEFMR